MEERQTSLWESCCERCRHTPDEPCPDRLACRTAGPFCHADEGCVEFRIAVARRVAFGPGTLVAVGQGDCGRAVGSEAVLEVLIDKLPPDRFEVVPTGCLGFCSAEPLVWVARPDEPVALYGEIGIDAAVELARRLGAGDGWPEKTLAFLPCPPVEERSFPDNRHLYSVDEAGGGFYPFYLDKQMRLVTAHCGLARPTSLDDHLLRRGFHPLFVLLRHLSLEDAFAILEESGLESRATGEPVTPLWRDFGGQKGLVRLDLTDGRANPGPLTRRLLEGIPFQVLESLLLVGLMTRAERVEVVLPASWSRAETLPAGELRRRYTPRGRAPEENLKAALEKLRDAGLVGKGILGTAFSCSISIVAEPTVDDRALEVELETALNLPVILEMGGEWFRGFGHGRHPGTKCLLVGGPLLAKGFVELNLGTPLGDVANLVCGGAESPVGEAVLNGGILVPAARFDSLLDLPDPEPLPGPPVLGAPAVILFRAAAAAEGPRPAEAKAGISLSPFRSLLAEYAEIEPPAGLPVSVLLGWRMAGQRLRLLVDGASDEAELFHAGRLAGYLSREAPPLMARWAAGLLNAIHSQV